MLSLSISLSGNIGGLYVPEWIMLSMMEQAQYVLVSIAAAMGLTSGFQDFSGMQGATRMLCRA
jgi:hypothetical protein